MEKELFDLYERHSYLNIEVGHNKVADWNLYIYDRKNDAKRGRGEPVVCAESPDRSKVFAEAYVKLTDYLSDRYGGY